MKRIAFIFASIALSTLGCDKDEPPPTAEAPVASAVASVAPAPAPSEAPTEAAPPEGATFEGEVDLVMETKQPKPSKMDAKMLLKDGKMRMELEGLQHQGGVSQIIDTNTGDMVSLAHGPKMAMTMKMDGILKSLAPWMPVGEDGDPERPVITKTERTEEIVGETCRYWDYKFKGGERGSVCLADIEAGWVHMASLEEAKWAQKAFEGHRFPLAFINYDTAGKETATMKVTRLERKSVPDSAFQIPKGYQRLDTSKMMEGLMPAMMQAAGSARPKSVKLPENAQQLIEKMKKAHGEKQQ